MLYFLDTEFYEDGQRIHPISLALVREDGEFLYLELPFDDSIVPAGHFVRTHVLPKISRHRGNDPSVWWQRGKAHRKIGISKKTAREFIDDFVGDDPYPQFWAYYADYDWVLFCQCYGTMMDLPERFPQLCMDLQQWWIQLGRPNVKPPQPKDAHDALVDALWNKAFFDALCKQRWQH